MASTAQTHSVYIFAWVEGDTIHTESYFGGKKKVRGGLIKVFDAAGRKLLEGKTNEKGEYSFKVPGTTDIRIVLDAGAGHGAEYRLKADELPDMAQRRDMPTEDSVSRTPSSSAAPADVEHLRMVVEKTLDSRLRPITKMLVKISEERGPGLTEVIGGIGYIFGLAGLVLYFKSRKKK